jgi:hypothetical protein
MISHIAPKEAFRAAPEGLLHLLSTINPYKKVALDTAMNA